jgi:hypothetical protein
MFKGLFSGSSSRAKLIQDIRNDNYKNWEAHFDNFNRTSTKKIDPVRLQSLGLEIYENNLKEIIGDYSITDEEKEVLIKIKDYFQLPDAVINSIKSKYAKNAVTELSKIKLADNQLTKQEELEIGLFAMELNISEDEVDRINRRNATELYQNFVKQAVADNMVSIEEQQALKRLAQELGIDIREAVIDKKLRDDYYYLVLLNALDQGYLPGCKTPSFVTQKDEVAYWEISSNLVLTRTNTTGNTSQGSKVRIKVAKGASYRLGASRSISINEHTTANHPGVFGVTNKGVIFAASKQSFAIPFTQLHSFDAYSDGIGLQKNDSELLLQFYDKQMSEVVFKVITNAINAIPTPL